jgi:hypothetical protein
LQFAALPVNESMVQPLSSSQVVGQLSAGSQVSPGSTAPLPQVCEQSLSVLKSHPAGQHPSSCSQETMGTLVHTALQFDGLPVIESRVHSMPSSQSVGQVSGGSHVSPSSMMLFPQLKEQSLSFVESQPAGQHPSASAQEMMGSLLQATLQFAALPVIESTVQSLPSLHVVGQLSGGSQDSPGSTISLPQLSEQSLSVVASQPAGQQPSPSPQETIGS